MQNRVDCGLGGYTDRMKTAVSIPDPLYRKADQCALREGLSRDDLYARAIGEYVRKREPRDDTGLIEELNAVCKEVDTSLDEGFKALRDAGPRRSWGTPIDSTL